MILSPKPYQALLEEIPTWSGNYLEIGVWEGDMLKDFATRWPEKMFYGIDPFISDCDTTGHTGIGIGERLESHRDSAYRNFKDVPNITFIEATSKVFSDAMSDERLEAMNLSIVYVDGSHTYHDTLVDLNLAVRAMKHGLIYVHDYELPEVIRATDNFIAVNGNRVVLRDKERIVLK